MNSSGEKTFALAFILLSVPARNWDSGLQSCLFVGVYCDQIETVSHLPACLHGWDSVCWTKPQVRGLPAVFPSCLHTEWTSILLTQIVKLINQTSSPTVVSYLTFSPPKCMYLQMYVRIMHVCVYILAHIAILLAWHSINMHAAASRFTREICREVDSSLILVENGTSTVIDSIGFCHLLITCLIRMVVSFPIVVWLF